MMIVLSVTENFFLNERLESGLCGVITFKSHFDTCLRGVTVLSQKI